MRFISAVLLASTCVLLSANAQEKSKRTCRILFLSAPAGAPEKLFLSDGAAAQEVELPSMNLSPVYPLAAGAITLTLLPSKPLPDAPLPEGAPKALVGESFEDIYLLVTSDPSNKIAPVRFQVINAKADGFKNGQLLWYNLSPHRIGGQLGTRSLNLAPNAKAIMDAPASKAEDYNVKIGYVPAGGKAEPLCETLWRHDPRSKNIVFVVPVAESRMPRIMGFPDSREPEEKEPAP